MARQKTDPVEKAVQAVLDLTIEQRNSFDVALRMIERRSILIDATPRTTPRRQAEKKTKPAPEQVNG